MWELAVNSKTQFLNDHQLKDPKEKFSSWLAQVKGLLTKPECPSAWSWRFEV